MDTVKYLGKRQSFALIGMLVVLAIVLFLSYFLWHSYFIKPFLNKSARQAFSAEHYDTSSIPALIKSVRNKVKEINRAVSKRQKQIEEFNK